MIELLKQELRIVEDVGVLLRTYSSTLFGFNTGVNLCLILSQGCKLVIIIVTVK